LEIVLLLYHELSLPEFRYSDFLWLVLLRYDMLGNFGNAPVAEIQANHCQVALLGATGDLGKF